MPTSSNSRLSTVENKKAFTSHPATVTKTSKDISIPTRKPIDPFVQRLNHIRIHLLNNTKAKKFTFSEPTLVFDKFLYIGGLKSLQKKVSFTHRVYD